MLRHILIIFFLPLLLLVPNALAQQASMVWDEKTKSWVSTPTAPTTTPTPQIQQQQIPTTTTQPQIVYQQQPTPTVGQATVDFGTLATIITPIIAGIAGIFVKQKKDMEKKDEEVKQETIKAIEAAIVPKLKQITPVAEQTAKQSVQLNQLAEELYKVMADKANEIQNKPEIQQAKLIEDVIQSKVIAEQTKASGTPVWDEKTKSWISK